MQREMGDIVFGFKNMSHEDAEKMKEAFASKGVEFTHVCVKYTKNQVLQQVKDNKDVRTVIVMENLETKPFTAEELKKIKGIRDGMRVIVSLSNDRKGTRYMRELYENGIYRAVFDDNTGFKYIYSLVCETRSRKATRKYYGLPEPKMFNTSNMNKERIQKNVDLLEQARNEKEMEDILNHMKHMLTPPEIFVVLKHVGNPALEKIILCNGVGIFFHMNNYRRAKKDEGKGSFVSKFIKAGKAVCASDYLIDEDELEKRLEKAMGLEKQQINTSAAVAEKDLADEALTTENTTVLNDAEFTESAKQCVAKYDVLEKEETIESNKINIDNDELRKNTDSEQSVLMCAEADIKEVSEELAEQEMPLLFEEYSQIGECGNEQQKKVDGVPEAEYLLDIDFELDNAGDIGSDDRIIFDNQEENIAEEQKNGKVSSEEYSNLEENDNLNNITPLTFRRSGNLEKKSGNSNERETENDFEIFFDSQEENISEGQDIAKSSPEKHSDLIETKENDHLDNIAPLTFKRGGNLKEKSRNSVAKQTSLTETEVEGNKPDIDFLKQDSSAEEAVVSVEDSSSKKTDEKKVLEQTIGDMLIKNYGALFFDEKSKEERRKTRKMLKTEGKIIAETEAVNKNKNSHTKCLIVSGGAKRCGATFHSIAIAYSLATEGKRVGICEYGNVHRFNEIAELLNEETGKNGFWHGKVHFLSVSSPDEMEAVRYGERYDFFVIDGGIFKNIGNRVFSLADIKLGILSSTPWHISDNRKYINEMNERGYRDAIYLLSGGKGESKVNYPETNVLECKWQRDAFVPDKEYIDTIKNRIDMK